MIPSLGRLLLCSALGVLHKSDPSPPPGHSVLVERAEEHAASGDFLTAVNDLTFAIEQVAATGDNPSLERALILRLGEIHAEAFRLTEDHVHFAQALELLLLYIELCPEAADADRSGARGQIDALLSFKDRVSGLRFTRALVEAGERRYDDGDYLGAITAYRTALLNLPPDNDAQHALILGAIAAAHVKQYQVHGDILSLETAETVYRQYRDSVTMPILLERVDTKLASVAEMKATERRWQLEFEASKLRPVPGTRKFIIGGGNQERTMTLSDAYRQLGRPEVVADLRRFNRVIGGGFTTSIIALAGTAAVTVLHFQRNTFDTRQFAALVAQGSAIGIVGTSLAIWALVQRNRRHALIHSLIDDHNLELQFDLRIKRAKQAYEGWSLVSPQGASMSVSVRF